MFTYLSWSLLSRFCPFACSGINAVSLYLHLPRLVRRCEVVCDNGEGKVLWSYSQHYLFLMRASNAPFLNVSSLLCKVTLLLQDCIDFL